MYDWFACGRETMRFLAAVLLVTTCAVAQKLIPVKTRERRSRSALVTTVAASSMAFPFAAPPLGSLRWKPPQPVLRSLHLCSPTSLAKPAYRPCPAAVRRGPRSSWCRTRPEKACLNLNVWAPPPQAKRTLCLSFFTAVDLNEGSNGITSYDGTALARRGLIVVTANYRLGLFGYFSSTALEQESPTHAAGNYAVADQIAMLQWVQRNIAAFGGDPRRVALAGQSRGRGKRRRPNGLARWQGACFSGQSLTAALGRYGPPEELPGDIRFAPYPRETVGGQPTVARWQRCAKCLRTRS